MCDELKGNPIKVYDSPHLGHPVLTVKDGKLDQSTTGGWRVYSYDTKKVYLFPADLIIVVSDVES